MAIRAIGKYISSLGWQLSGNIVRAQGHAVKRRKKEKRKKTLPKCHSTSFCLLAGCCSFLRHDSSFRGRRRSILYAFTLVFCKVFFFNGKWEKNENMPLSFFCLFFYFNTEVVFYIYEVETFSCERVKQRRVAP